MEYTEKTMKKAFFALLATLAVPTAGRSQQFKNTYDCEMDNYLQFAPTALTFGLNIAGVEGRNSLARLTASSAMSYALMAAIAQPLKHWTSEMRPDRSTDDAFPSGHTATAFVGATILHKEYGKTVSPWFSVAGYTAASATGLMRVIKNRHWAGDVLTGAGIGIVATEIAYGLSDLIFKDKGRKRPNLSGETNLMEHPSFIGISMGMALGCGALSFSGSDIMLKSHTTTVAGIEGAYFLSPYIGVGGRLRVGCTPMTGWEDTNVDLEVESSHMTEYTADAGLYFSLPLGNNLALGTKALIGESFIDGLDINASKGTESRDYLDVDGNNTVKYGTGLSLTYSNKRNSSFKVFVDYDFTRKHYTMEYDYAGFLRSAWPTITADTGLDVSQPSRSEIKKNLNNFVLGGAFCVSF